MKKETSYSGSWIHSLENKRRWELYWMQQKIMEPYIRTEHQLLELGVGSGFCSNYLRSKNFNVETIDIDAEKKPDILCDIRQWEPQKKYDGFLSFQVFEHMHFSMFEEVIQKLSREKIEYLYISVPYNSMSKTTVTAGRFYLPKIGFMDFELKWPFFKSAPIRCKTHIWELNDKDISTKKYYDVYNKYGYEKIYSEKMYYAQYDVFRLNSSK